MAVTYEKTYAVVVAVERDVTANGHGCPVAIIVEKYGMHQRAPVRLLLRWRNGYGHTSGPNFGFDKGTVVKIYQRQGDCHLKFRRVGS